MGRLFSCTFLGLSTVYFIYCPKISILSCILRLYSLYFSRPIFPYFLSLFFPFFRIFQHNFSLIFPYFPGYSSKEKPFYVDALQSTAVDRLDLPYYDPEHLLATMETLRAEAADYQARLQAATFAEQGWKWDDATQAWIRDTQEGVAIRTPLQLRSGVASRRGGEQGVAGAEPPVPGLEEEPPAPGDDAHLLPPGVDVQAPVEDFSDEMAAFYSEADVTQSTGAQTGAPDTAVPASEISGE